MRTLTVILAILFTSAIGSMAKDSRPQVQLPGQRADGSVLLPNQWSLRPVGQQIELGDFPINIAVHPQSRMPRFCIRAIAITESCSSTCRPKRW